MILIPLGPPGSGKGTQAKRISEKHGLAHLSTGDMFRAAIQQGTKLGKEAKSFMDRGELVPDSVTIGLIADRIEQPDCKNGFILDGFPRTVPQAEALGALLQKRGTPVDVVVQFEVPDKDLVGRLSGRRICSKCGAMYHLTSAPPQIKDVCDKCGSALVHRSDDHEDVIRNRLTVYRKQTAPLIGYYQKSGIRFETLDATRTPDQVEQQLKKFL